MLVSDPGVKGKVRHGLEGMLKKKKKKERRCASFRNLTSNSSAEVEHGLEPLIRSLGSTRQPVG